MESVPGRRGNANVVRAGLEAVKFIGSGVVGRVLSGGANFAFAGVLIQAEEMDLSAADRLSRVIGNDAADDRGREKLQAEAIGVQIRANDDAGEESIVVLITGGDVAAARGFQPVLAGLQMIEAKAAVLGSDGFSELRASRTGGGERNLSAIERSAGSGADDGAADAEGCRA